MQAADLFVSVTLISTDVDGNVVESDILDQVTFNDVTPASLYEQNAPYFAGTVQAYYNGLPIDGATPAVYVGLKGDADLNGKVEVEDAVAILTYYAQKSAALPTVFQEDPMLNTLAYYLADVDTESKLGMNHAASGQSISVEDAVYVLTYYAQTSAALHPSWESILQK